MYCAKCGKEVSEEMKYCPYCSNKLSQETEIVDNNDSREKSILDGHPFLSFLTGFAEEVIGVILFLLLIGYFASR